MIIDTVEKSRMYKEVPFETNDQPGETYLLINVTKIKPPMFQTERFVILQSINDFLVIKSKHFEQFHNVN